MSSSVVNDSVINGILARKNLLELEDEVEVTVFFGELVDVFNSCWHL